MVGRASWAGLLGVALLLALAGTTRGQAPATESAVKVTVGGVSGPIVRARPRAFAAVRVVLENEAQDEVEGTIRVYRGSGPGKPIAQQSLFYERRVSLPGRGKRAETVYYYCQENEPARHLVVAFQPDDGPAPAPVFPELQLHRDQALVLLVSSQESEEALRVFRSALLPTPRRILRAEAVRAELTALPDHMAGYDPFDAVVVTDLDAAELQPGQAKALVDWVQAGGDLIIAYSRRPLPQALRDLLPVLRPPGADRAVERPLVALRALGHGRLPPSDERVLCDDVQPAAGAEVLVTTASGPLVLRGREGAGWVTYLTFPLDAAPLRRWQELAWFGGRIVRGPRAELQGKSDAPMLAPPTEELQLNLSEAIATLTPPSALVIAPLLLLYVALVSPINYSLLVRRRRLHLAQPVAAGVVVVFGLVFYGLGRLYKGSEDMVTQVAVLEVPPKEGLARVDVMTGYYSTSQALVGAAAPPGAVVGPLAEELTGREGRVLQEAGGARLDALTVATWSLRRFRTLRAQDVGAVQVDVALERSVLRGKVTNRTAVTLEEPLLLLPSGFVQLGKPLLPGETIELKGSGLVSYLEGARVEQLGLTSLLARDATNRYPAVYGRDAAMSAMSSADPYQGRGHLRVLGTLVHRLRRVPWSHDRVPLLLAARASADPGGVRVDGTAEPKLARQLVLVEGQARLPVPGPILLTGLEPRLENIPRREEDWVPVDGPTGAAPQLGGGLTEAAEVVFFWTLPSNDTAPLRADVLRLRWMIPGLMNTTLAIESDVQAFDFTRRTWTVLVKQGDAESDDDGFRVVSVPGPKAPPHLAPDDLIDAVSGTVLIKLRNHGSDLRLAYIGLDVSGQR